MFLRPQNSHRISRGLSRLFSSPRFIAMVVSLSATTLTGINTAYAATLADLQTLMGQPSLAHEYSHSQEQFIISHYQSIHTHNLEAQALILSNPSSLNAKYLLETRKINALITSSETQLQSDFSSDAPVSTVLQDSAQVGNLTYQLSQVPQPRAVLKMRIEPDPYKQQYFSVMNVINTLASYTDLGLVGESLQSPVGNQFILTLPYGTILNKATGKSYFNSSLDLLGGRGAQVISIWNGTVSSVVLSSSGDTVVVNSGSGVTESYSNLSKVFVHQGQVLQYYTPLGLLGVPSSTLGYSLQFQIDINGSSVDPLYFFGRKGALALENYIMLSSNPSIKAMWPLVFEIKNNLPGQQSGSSQFNQFFGPRPVNYNKPDNAPAGSIPIRVHNGYSMPTPSASINN